VIGDDTADDASLYVLGLLTPEEARKFQAMLAADPELAELVGRLETAAAALAWTAPPRDPPPALRARIAGRIQPEEEELPNRVVAFPSRTAWVPWAVAACFALTTAGFCYKRYENRLVMADFLLRDRAQQAELDRVQSRDVALQLRLDGALSLVAAAGQKNEDLQRLLDTANGEVADLKTRNALSEIKIAMLASMAKEAPQAAAVVAWDGGSQRGIVKTVHMPSARADQDYQLWIIDPDYKTPVSAGVFDPGKGANFAPDHPISKADKFAVSLEKKGGAPAPQGPIVLVSE
jgi:anti-sigma-K factor RskA